MRLGGRFSGSFKYRLGSRQLPPAISMRLLSEYFENVGGFGGIL
jgi:hypothetical protein